MGGWRRKKKKKGNQSEEMQRRCAEETEGNCSECARLMFQCSSLTFNLPNTFNEDEDDDLCRVLQTFDSKGFED